jgi:hypothetical protein
MSDKEQTKTAQEDDRQVGDGDGKLSPKDMHRLFDEGYHDIEILPDGTLRETTRDGDTVTESVTRSLKTERTWY